MLFRSKTAIQNEITITCLNSNFNSKPQKFNEFCIQNFGTFFNLSFFYTTQQQNQNNLSLDYNAQ